MKLAVLRIISLQEEFSRYELRRAVDFVSTHRTDDLLAWLAGEGESAPKTARRTAGRPSSNRSLALAELRDGDPERYRLLHEIDGLLRDGSLLPKLEDVRKLGVELDKSFTTGKTRRDAIPRLMELLAGQSLERIRPLVHRIILDAAKDGEKDKEYERLAAFLMHGKNIR
ncbi:MAG: hypothetical protein HKM95_15745 [Inquilinus sp.]|nr:hypothetical protein [Inquilinus sp.]